MPEQLVIPNTSNANLQPDAHVQPDLSEEQQAIQAKRDEWTQEYPGKSYLTPEGPTLGPEDISRLESTAAVYDLDQYDSKNIAEVYSDIQEVGTKREAELRAKYQNPEYKNDGVEELIRQKRDLAIEEERIRIVEETLPYPPEAKRRHRKKVDKERDKLFAILNKSQKEFEALQADWQAYEDVLHTKELNSQHAEALGDDKILKAVVERARIKQELAGLDEQNGSVLDYMAQYSLESDAAAAEIIKKYRETVAKHPEDEDLTDADRLNAARDFKWRLGELIAEKSEAQGAKLSDEAIAGETQEAMPYIETWLEAMAESKNDPLADLNTYKQKERAYQGWDKKRREAVEFLAPMILLRTVQRRLSGENEPEKPQEQQPLSPEKSLKIIIDPRNIGNKNGANTLLHADELSPTDIKLYNAGVRGQLELARNYSRHQSNILKAALIFNALAVGGYQTLNSNLSSAWDRIPEKDRRQAFKKITLGKGVTWSVKSRRLARQAAQRLEKNQHNSGSVLNSDNLAREVIKKDS